MAEEVSTAIVQGSTPPPAEGGNSPKSWRMCEIEQDCSFGWDLQAAQKFVDGWAPVERYYFILHIGDFKEGGNAILGTGDPRDPHVHLLVRFTHPVPTSAIIARAKAIGLPDDCITPNRIQKIKKWSNAVNYLTHRDEGLPWKRVYDISDVITNGDYELDAQEGHASKVLRRNNLRLVEILKSIEEGIIKEYNINEHLTVTEQVLYDNDIAKAFKVVNAINAKGEREMEVMFVSGPSGVGKDTFAREWCRKRNLDYYCTNNNPENPFDDYKGEPVIIWSDARDNVFKPHNLHQLFDNHYSSKQKSRYHDTYIAAKYMIVTSIKPIEEWYTKFYNDDKEDKTQLYRRVRAVFEMNEKDISMKVWNGSTKVYDRLPASLPNTFMHKEDQLSSEEDQLKFAKNLLGSMAQDFQFISDNIDNPAYK
jgi:hypothetical protein